jgi:TonB family protein
MRQTRQLALLLFVASGACSVAHPQTTVAQTAETFEAPRFDVVLNNVYLPVYPPLARQARIMGDVKILVGVRQDGSVESAEVVSGHPMLKQAALESAQKSTFLCRECKGAVTLFTVTYTYGTRVDPDGIDCSGPQRLRSAKCLGLWKCGGWRSPAPPKAAVGQTLDDVMILESAMCVEAESARSEREPLSSGGDRLSAGHQ